MRNRILIVLTLLILVSLVVSACAAPPAGSGTTGGKKKIGLVTDVGGVNDKSFNQSAWDGVQKAAKEYGWDAKFIESKQPTDYEKNIDQLATDLEGQRLCSRGFEHILPGRLEVDGIHEDQPGDVI
jgi:basic membrane protein A